MKDSLVLLERPHPTAIAFPCLPCRAIPVTMPKTPTASDTYKHWTFTLRPELLTYDQRVKLAYARAKAITLAWSRSFSPLLNTILTAAPSTDLSIHDVGACTTRFWDLQRDPILALDVGCNNIIACHLNLFLGTIIPMLPRRPDLLPIVERGLRCELIGNMLLSEIGHGLDILNIETTATTVADGFILNTPHPDAAKYETIHSYIRAYSQFEPGLCLRPRPFLDSRRWRWCSRGSSSTGNSAACIPSW